MTVGDVVVFHRYGVLAEGTLEWPDFASIRPTRVEIGEKGVIRHYGNGQVCVHLSDGRLIWFSDLYLEDYVKTLD